MGLVHCALAGCASCKFLDGLALVACHGGILSSLSDGIVCRHHRSPALAMKPAGQDPRSATTLGTSAVPLCLARKASPFPIILLLGFHRAGRRQTTNQKTRRESRKKAPDFSSMIEVHLDPTATIEFISFDPIGVLVDQKAREAGDGLFIGEQRVFGWSPVGKLYQLTIVANVHIEIEFVKADFGL